MTAKKKYCNIITMPEKKEFYIHSPAGDSMLVEMYEELGSVTVLIGDNMRLDLDYGSAFDLADALMVIANSMESYYDREY